MSAEVFWIKLHTSTFDSETIMLLESMPEGDTLLVIWFKMQILAGKCNAGGYLLLNGECPYSDEMLATVFRRPLNTVRLAISAFLKFMMVEVIDGAYFLPEWEKHQNVSGLEKIREQTRKRVARCRAKSKDVTLHVTQGNATETEPDLESEKQQRCIRLLLVKTPFEILDKTELEGLLSLHGFERVVQAADVAAETWRREQEEIRNPGGYLNTVCASLVVPSWYLSPEERKNRALAAEERRLIAIRAEEEKKAIADRVTNAKEDLWSTLSEVDRDGFRIAAKASINVGLHVPAVAVTAIAKSMAWEKRSQMSNIESLHRPVNMDDTMCNQ